MSRSPLIIAHRGDSSHAPENTLAAIRIAIETGAEGVEFDVRLAGDGVPVVIHDATLRRTGRRRERVADLTADELAGVDVGSWFNRRHPSLASPVFSNESVPTLARVLDTLAGFGGLIYVELKADDQDYQPLARAVCDLIRNSSLLPQIIVKSFKLGVIPEVRSQIADVQTAALFETSIMNLLKRREHIIALAREFGADQLSLHHGLVRRSLMTLARECRMPVTVWTVDRPAWLSRCRRFGVTAIITNDPGRMIAARDAAGTGVV